MGTGSRTCLWQGAILREIVRHKPTICIRIIRPHGERLEHASAVTPGETIHSKNVQRTAAFLVMIGGFWHLSRWPGREKQSLRYASNSRIRSETAGAPLNSCMTILRTTILLRGGGTQGRVAIPRRVLRSNWESLRAPGSRPAPSAHNEHWLLRRQYRQQVAT
jgi:hypothetical protein